MVYPPLPTEAISETYPKTDAEADLLRPIMVGLLRTIPETWTEFDYGRQTNAEERAASLLVAAGMVERRGRYRASFTDHPVCFEIRWEATGESGYTEVVERVSATEYATWGDAWRAWKAGETGHVSPFHTEHLTPQEWRLTDQGVLARKELESDADNVLDFALKRGPYGPGYYVRKYVQDPAFVQTEKGLLARYTAAGFDWRSLPRLPLRGYGQVVEIRKIENSKDPQAVNVANWTEGGDALAVAFGKMLEPYFEAMGKATQGNTRPADGIGDDPDTPLSPAKLADRLGIPESDAKAREALRKRLESWRKANLDGGWIETRDPKPREPRYLYPLGKVWPLIQDLKPSG